MIKYRLKKKTTNSNPLFTKVPSYNKKTKKKDLYRIQAPQSLSIGYSGANWFFVNFGERKTKFIIKKRIINAHIINSSGLKTFEKYIKKLRFS
jgi:hypothetical protein